MALPIVVVASGGLAVTESANGFGLPVEVAANGFGKAVTIVASGGLPVVGSGAGVPAAVPAVDLTALAAAPVAFWGTVRLSTYSAASPCVQVIRSSDSATQDIGFVNGQIDMASALTFAGGSTLNISKWYNQGSAGASYDATASSNRPNLTALNVVNGIQAIGFDGSNGAPLITRQMAVPNLALDIAALTLGFVGRQTISANTSAILSLSSVTPATIAKWQVLSGISYVATSTQTTAQHVPINPLSLVMQKDTNTVHSIAERSFSRTATTGTGTSVAGIIGNDVTGTSRGCFEAVALVAFAAALSTPDQAALQTALEAPFPTPIQRTFTETVAITGDSILQGTGTTFNQNLTAQLYPLLDKPTRMINAGIFGATQHSLLNQGSGYFNPFKGWTNANGIIWGLQSGSNDLASSFTAASCTTTNGSAVVTTVNTTQLVVGQTVVSGAGISGSPTILSISAGVSFTMSANAGVGAGAGTVTLQDNAVSLKNAATIFATSATAAAMTRKFICTILPRNTWVGLPQPWIEAQAYNADVRLNFASMGYDFVVDLAGDAIMGDIANTADTAYFADGLHPNNGGNARLAPIYAAALNAFI